MNHPSEFPAVLLILTIFCFPLEMKSQDIDDIHLNKIIDKLENEELVTGIWVSALHPANARGLVEFNNYPSYQEAITSPMIDFILIDMEHEPFDVTRLREFLLALNSKREVIKKGNLQPNISTLVRFPAEGRQPVYPMIKQVLDMGVHGVVIPHVQSAAEAKKAVRACRYEQPVDAQYQQPEGMRGASPHIASYLWGLTLDEYVEKADLWPLNPQGDLLAIAMIEDQEGVENIDAILEVPGLGGVMFGPYDFSFDIGHPGETGHPRVTQALDKIKKACEEHEKPLIGLANRENIKQRLRNDYRMLLIGSDANLNSRIPEILEIIQMEKE